MADISFQTKGATYAIHFLKGQCMICVVVFDALKPREPIMRPLLTSLSLILMPLLLALPARAADLIEGGPYNTAPAYGVTMASTVCDDLKIDYRRPYTPHTEIVQICHQPVDLTPSGLFDPGGARYGARAQRPGATQ